MSWMDSWSRPSKSQATPPPYYLLPGGDKTPYCHRCGRIIGTLRLDFLDDPDKRFGRRKNRARRGVKDGDVWKSVDMESDESDDDQHDEAAESKEGILSLTKTQSKNSKFTGDSLENESSEEDKEANGGLSITSHVPSAAESGTQLDADVIARLSIRSGTRIRPSQEVSEVNGGVGGEKGLKERIVEGEDMLQKRREGQKKADQRELVRCAARRGVAFGFVVKNRGEKDEQRRLCEAVMQGKVVESSFAKGPPMVYEDAVRLGASSVESSARRHLVLQGGPHNYYVNSRQYRLWPLEEGATFHNQENQVMRRVG
ncbi:hypothetical protein M7I_7708 [Glarea lozoyensis 74030]|uniref:Uncharacterized protein n=1 Tax=Glarea lozoyensis (strain ATCC 74030 / MF5533) TaxID=1104152 RepID=H0EY12_GLAL7|nr:hypothetical protein M7I_7708 [Glarea lozoyensis 74030]